MDLTPPEKRLIEAMRDGDICTFPLDEVDDDVEDAEALAARTIRSSVLKAALAGIYREWPAPYRRISLWGARIVGELDLIFLRRRWDDGSTIPQFSVWHCQFDEVFLSGAAFEGVEFSDCSLKLLHANDLKVEGRLVLNDCTVERYVSIDRAQIGSGVNAIGLTVEGEGAGDGAAFSALSARISGGLDLSGANLTGRWTALNISGATITGAAFLRMNGDKPFRAVGMVEGTGAAVEGGVELIGAQLHCETDLALCLARLETRGCVFMRGDRETGLPFRAVGPINFKGARIGGYVRIIDAVLSPSETAVRRHGEVFPAKRKPGPVDEAAEQGAAEMMRCLDFERARIDSFLEMRDISAPGGGRPRGDYHFAGVHVAELIDDPETAWPEKGRLDLDGFTYGTISFHPSERRNRAGSRLKWLELRYSRRLRRDDFRPQPYEELARVLRLLGHGDDADEVAIAKRRMRTRSGAEGFLSSLTSNFMGLVAKYGYSPARILATMALYVGLGALAITALMQAGLIEFRSVEDAVEATRYVALWPWPLPGHEVSVAASPDGCPSLVAPLYALDLTLPILDLGQESACRLETSGTTGGLVQAGRGLYQILGAILTAITVTTLTGLLRKD
ncbi:MAG: hypothetical protein QM608_06740 [Caulobacter sp.]